MQWWDSKNLKNRDFLLTLWGAMFLIFPGITALAVFHQNLLSELNWVILLFLSAAMTFPFVVMNTVVFMIWEEKEKKEEQRKDALFYNFFISSMATGLASYAAIAVGYYAGYTLSQILGAAIVVEFLFCGYYTIEDAARAWLEKRQNAKTEVVKIHDQA